MLTIYTHLPRNYTIGYNATLEWIKLGGRRIDSASSYLTQKGVGQGKAVVTGETGRATGRDSTHTHTHTNTHTLRVTT
jgi:diketogulonate reductase-like aldo/keto reductase